MEPLDVFTVRDLRQRSGMHPCSEPAGSQENRTGSQYGKPAAESAPRKGS